MPTATQRCQEGRGEEGRGQEEVGSAPGWTLECFSAEQTPAPPAPLGKRTTHPTSGHSPETGSVLTP